jgi:HD-like signal output (HDOD) protein
MIDNLPESLVLRIKKEKVLALPQSAVSIMELAKNPENGPAEFAVPISTDPGLASQILSFANSSYFGFRHKITTIRSALSLISVRAMRNFVLWNAVFAMLPNPKECGFFRLKIILQDGIRRGTFSKLLASHFSGIDPDEVFVTALFQDIALPVLVNYFPGDYKMLFQEQSKTGKRLSELEQQHFGWNHGQAGAFLIQEWGISDGLTNVVEQHAYNKEIPSEVSAQDMSDVIVRLSSLLPSAANDYWDDAETDTFFAVFYKIAVKKYLNEKGMPQISSLFSTVDADADELLGKAKVSRPETSLSLMLQRYSDMISDTDIGA